MSVYILSDLHLHDENQPYLFNDLKEKVFIALVDDLLAEGGKLVLAGDIFDLTGMTPPKHGLEDFFDEVLSRTGRLHPAVLTTSKHRTVRDQLGGIRQRFPGFFLALGRLAAKRNLTIIPGNHDCVFQTAEGRRAFCEMAHCGDDLVSWAQTYRHDSFLVAHGNEFDPSNDTHEGCHNHGSVMAGVFFNAVIPALRALQVPKEFVEAIPALRPEEAIVRDIEFYLGEKMNRTFLVAFARLLGRNGYFAGIQNLFMWMLVHKVPGISRLVQRTITPDKLRSALPDKSGLKRRTRKGALALLSHARAHAASKNEPMPEVIILGHTHQLDFLPNYVNLGTWSDHVTGLTPHHLEHADESLPVLCIENDHSAALWDARDMIDGRKLRNCKAFWRYLPRQLLSA